jgi:hypothetical protein
MTLGFTLGLDVGTLEIILGLTDGVDVKTLLGIIVG